jgi:hypothetical protein
MKLMVSKEHITPEGLREILSIKASLNRGLPEKLKAEFPDILPITRSLVVNQQIKDPYWLAGFADGEGNFYIDIYKAKTNIGFGVTLRFKLNQHSRDAELMKTLIEYLGCGNYYLKQDIVEFIVKRCDDNLNKIIPFFDKYPLLGNKALDFADFKRAVELVAKKDHLTELGLEELRLIKSKMNRGREN